jgi:hypothetical protein
MNNYDKINDKMISPYNSFYFLWYNKDLLIRIIWFFTPILHK